MGAWQCFTLSLSARTQICTDLAGTHLDVEVGDAAVVEEVDRVEQLQHVLRRLQLVKVRPAGDEVKEASGDRERKRTASGAGGGVRSETIVSHETEFRGDTIIQH